ncbi:MAG: 2,3-bisphosphoglycerate-independent phosphoglycerate mutase [bacterium]
MPLVLIVLDGWGQAPPSEKNAISLAKKPFFDSLWQNYPHALLHADGEWVGLPRGEVGSSETGHLTIGAGRAVNQDYSRINTSLEDGAFFENSVLREAFLRAMKSKASVHLIGLAGMGGIHSSRFHLYGLLELARRVNFPKNKVKIHLFSDGRDTDPQSGLEFSKELQEVIAQKGVGEVVSLMGRYWAMDRDRRWRRTQKAYNALVKGKAGCVDTIENAFEQSYQKGVTDEFIEPVFIGRKNPIVSGDTVIHFNFRTDRARQLAKALAMPQFDKFKRPQKLANLYLVTMVEFEKDLPVQGVVFCPVAIKNTLGAVLSERQIKQARVAETEKYAFVTYYFNGLCEECIGTEENFLIPSPKVPTYDLKPEMSTRQVAAQVVKLLESKEYPFILVNFASPDMVAHTGKKLPTIKAIESVDKALSEVIGKVLAQRGTAIITADHGNAEDVSDTQHNANPVPAIVVGREFERGIFKGTVEKTGSLADVAPTVLKIMGIAKPQEMTGKSLL